MTDKNLCTSCGTRPRAAHKTRCLECLAAERAIIRDRERRCDEIAAERAEMLADAEACRDILERLKSNR